MLTFSDAKTMARSLRTGLANHNIAISHAQALELVAGQFGFGDWNVLAARIAVAESADTIAFTETAPIMRIFDEAKAREFYVCFLGFKIDWEHRFGDNFPLYMAVSRAELVLHLSGHHGDATPGSTVFVRMKGIRAYQRELKAKNYTNMKPGIEDEPWGLVMAVVDPFGNHIRFCESHPE
jgi:hypothetical protein